MASPISGPGFERCIVFQEDALFPWLTVEENIAFGLKGRINKREIKKRVGKFLYLTGLEGFGRYLPSEISGGMKQRVALARVLVLDPKLLLMDEPFGSLDAQSREEMQSLLLSLWEELRHTIIFVTHDITEAAFLADRILVMDKYPGSIKLIVDVSLKRPRRKENKRISPFLPLSERSDRAKFIAFTLKTLSGCFIKEDLRGPARGKNCKNS